MRICLTLPSLRRESGGLVVKSGGLVQELRRRGHEVTIVGCGDQAGEVSLPTLLNYHTTPVPRSIAPLIRAVTDADIVHILGFRDPVGTIAAFSAWRRGVPFVLEPTGMHRRRVRSFRLKSLYDKTLGRSIIARAAAVIATSRIEAQELRADGVPSELMQVRPNGVSVDDLLPLPARGAFRDRHSVPSQAPLILSIGRIARKKRLDHLVAALGDIGDAWAALIGPDDHDGGLQDIIAAQANHRVSNRLVVLPQGVWGMERAQLLADADCFCMPSSAENFGTAAVEAAAVGLPVVITDRCGGTEWLKTAIVVPYGDVGRLTEGLRSVIGDRETKARAVEAAPALRERLSWSAIAQHQLEIYAHVLESSTATRIGLAAHP